jgi:hypothetical protein
MNGQVSDTVNTILIDEDITSTHDTTPAADEDVDLDGASNDDPSSTLPLDAILVETVAETIFSPITDLLEVEPCAVMLNESSPVPFHVTYSTKHIHWLKFKRHFMVDKLTVPFISRSLGCSHDSTCVYESNDLLDCPFHEPRM